MNESDEMNDGIHDFAERTAFVTGGARGIGLGIVHALLRRGARVAIADISGDALRQAGGQLEASGSRLRCYQLDVADRDQYAEVAAAVQRDLGQVTLLFNNAGVIDSVSPRLATYQMWDYVMGINLNGVYNGIQTFLPGMLGSGRGGHIVNTSSEAGLVHAGSGFLYHASKFAVAGLSEALREELSRQGIGVSVLFPGPVATDIVLNTKQIRPDTAPTHSARVRQILDIAHRQLNEAGAPPDGVGELVLRAVERNEPYIATRNVLAEHLDHRNRQLVAAMQQAERVLASPGAKVTTVGQP
ncbi:SDR family NAD(P)-dependent oxidoreductase [Nakamurella leprariae]|uniref:SDR family oxidoreductase n=1 Tax=Nakamurella leprariae TaxID=2803911 RepID=A0A938YDH1_9ACTN|nr:SDR family oxidoreductase [Nakamurella leprariae]MBM9467824.1 SDR family oxidoreductase [Nakamurella leprariae]